LEVGSARELEKKLDKEEFIQGGSNMTGTISV
jgi:hypothetical protein